MLEIKPYFCKSRLPAEDFEWETRTAEIPGSSFKQENVEVPKAWSQTATNIVASKYFYGFKEQRETSVRQLVHRVIRTIADWGFADGYFNSENGNNFYNELCWLVLDQRFAFNSPVWFNCGLAQQYGVEATSTNWYYDTNTGRIKQPQNAYEHPQLSACFCQSVEDNLESIMELGRREALLFKYGSGTGTNVSPLRSMREGLSGGGVPSGPLSFMRIYDQIAEVVTSGGRTRRAALLRCMNTDHPDIMEYITCKMHEDRKARMLIEHGLDPTDAYKSVMYQNANLSVRVSDAFMEAVVIDADWKTYWRTDPKIEGPTYKARELWRQIAEGAWACGDPGLQFDTTINKWFPCPYEGRNNTSNPCGEFLGHDNSACNLASLNLMKFFDSVSGKLQHQDFQVACRLVTIAQEILVDRASYPTKEICKNAHRLRPIGLGYTNLGAVIMCSGNPYDSDDGRKLAASITALMHGVACLTSIELAKNLEPFEAYEDNKAIMLSIMDSQADCAGQLLGPKYLTNVIQDIWCAVIDQATEHGFRNSQLTLSAPAGTISFLMDADTTGIEPDLSLIKHKQLVGGGTLRMINQSVPKALKALGHTNAEIAKSIEYLEKYEELPDTVRDLHVFDTAIGKHTIPWLGHLKMLAAVQPFLSGGISKTVNLPSDATVEDIMEVYMTAWKMDLKSITVYRDGSKAYQPVNTAKVATKTAELIVSEGKNDRERLPDTRNSITHKFSIGGHEGYFTVGLYPDGRPGELFISVSKEGSTIGGLLDCFGIATSIGLQYGVPLDAFIVKFENTRFEPNGWTTNAEIRNAKSIIDYIFRWLAIQFKSEVLKNPVPNVEVTKEESNVVPRMDSPICTNCGALTVRVGACSLCYSCGTSGGCS